MTTTNHPKGYAWQIRGEATYNHKLTNDQVVELRKSASQGVSQRILARTFAVSQPHVCNIINRKKWAHLAADGKLIPLRTRKGHRLTDEAKRKISQARTGMQFTSEHKAKIGASVRAAAQRRRDATGATNDQK